jgi:hypothetical protein
MSAHHAAARPVPRAFAALLVAATLALSGCGGGVSVGVGIGYGYGYGYDDSDGYGDSAPTVTLGLSTLSAGAGTTVRLTAQPYDDYAVTQVDFDLAYPDGRVVALGGVRSAPWQLDVVLPAGTGGNVLNLRARAWDDAGQSGFSRWIGVSVR